MVSHNGVIYLENDTCSCDAGYRVIAPDMVGFGKSDKYISVEDYTHQMHVDKMTQLIVKLT